MRERPRPKAPEPFHDVEAPPGRWVYADGIARWVADETVATRAMRDPVECNCGKVYDTAAVTVTARYADCSVWRCPGCGAMSDDRKWVQQPYRSLR